jgi:hypothetical protein
VIPTEILRRVGRKAKRMLSPTGPTQTIDSTTEPATVRRASQPDPTIRPTSRPAVFDSYSYAGDLDSLGILLMPLAEYHGRELGAVADALTSLGHRCTFLVEQSQVEAIDKHLGTHPRILVDAQFDKYRLGSFDAFVAMNDWGEPSRAIYHLARVRGVPSFAKVEGVQDFMDVDTGRIRLPYLAADHVLVQGSNDVEALDRKNLHVVGNANMETAWNEGPASVDRNGEVVINSNFTYGVLTEVRDDFLAQAIEAIIALDLEPVISQHPADSRLPGEFVQYRTERSMSAMLPACEAVITRFSTVPFEAIAYGTPFIYFNPHGEKVPTFATPSSAFEHVRSMDALRVALLAAVESRARDRTRAEPYFRAQIDMTDTRSAMRAAIAIDSVTREPAPT